MRIIQQQRCGHSKWWGNITAHHYERIFISMSLDLILHLFQLSLYQNVVQSSNGTLMLVSVVLFRQLALISVSPGVGGIVESCADAVSIVDFQHSNIFFLNIHKPPQKHKYDHYYWLECLMQSDCAVNLVLNGLFSMATSTDGRFIPASSDVRVRPSERACQP